MTNPRNLWCNSYVVPSYQLRAELEKHIDDLNSQYVSMFEDKMNTSNFTPNPWKHVLAVRVEQMTGRNMEAVKRHLYRVMNGESASTDAEMADAYMLAVGKYLDQDTTIVTLPGNPKNAREMVLIRAENKGQKPTKEEIDHRVDVLLRFQHRRLYPDGYIVSRSAAQAKDYRAKRRARPESLAA